MIIVRDHNGYHISAVNDGYLVRRRYMGYCRRDAIRLFNREIKQLNKGDNQ